jgi:hypothetical protein
MAEDTTLAEFIKTNAPQFSISEQTPRDLVILQHLLASGGMFTLLWTVLKQWIDLRTDNTVSVTYVTDDDETIDVKMTRMTRDEVESFMIAHPPKNASAVKLVVLPA